MPFAGAALSHEPNQPVDERTDGRDQNDSQEHNPVVDWGFVISLRDQAVHGGLGALPSGITGRERTVAPTLAKRPVGGNVPSTPRGDGSSSRGIRAHASGGTVALL